MYVPQCIILYNTYFPCDNQKLVLSAEESAELQNLLNDISLLKQKLGDLNYDDNRYTGLTQAITNYLEELGHPIDYTFAFGQSHSTIDHFMISNSQPNIILEAGAVHDADNLSGHLCKSRSCQSQ